MKKYLVSIVLLISLFMLSGCGKEETEVTTCDPITDSSFKLLFNTNGGNEIDPYIVKTDIDFELYDILPIPTKEGYIFDGWYFDEELTKQVDGDYTSDVTPVPITVDGCTTGYEDVKIHAKWALNN